jgi:catechol 2,3-dioxygenase-like lactoylglutathione lyase family enzyme
MGRSSRSGSDASDAIDPDFDDHDAMTDATPFANPAVSFITIGVLDLERSRRFYAALGFVEHPRSNPFVAFFDLGGQVLSLFPRTALAEDAAVEAAPAGGGIAFSLARNVAAESDVPALLARAVAAGGRITREPSSPPWGGVRGYFADPDGVAWEVAWNPGMTVDERGRVAFTATT